MATKTDLVNFLKTNLEIKKINFQFLFYRIYPSGYTDIATAIDTGRIKLKTKLFSGGAAASYLLDSNTFLLSGSFNITSDYDLSFLVHESTHALLDYQNTGYGSRFEHEAVSYLAEAIWREAGGFGSIGGTGIRIEAHRIAASLLSTGRYKVSEADASALLSAVRAESHYAKKSNETYISDGF